MGRAPVFYLKAQNCFDEACHGDDKQIRRLKPMYVSVPLAKSANRFMPRPAELASDLVAKLVLTGNQDCGHQVSIDGVPYTTSVQKVVRFKKEAAEEASFSDDSGHRDTLVASLVGTRIDEPEPTIFLDRRSVSSAKDNCPHEVGVSSDSTRFNYMCDGTPELQSMQMELFGDGSNASASTSACGSSDNSSDSGSVDQIASLPADVDGIDDAFVETHADGAVDETLPVFFDSGSKYPPAAFSLKQANGWECTRSDVCEDRVENVEGFVTRLAEANLTLDQQLERMLGQMIHEMQERNEVLGQMVQTISQRVDGGTKEGVPERSRSCGVCGQTSDLAQRYCTTCGHNILA